LTTLEIDSIELSFALQTKTQIMCSLLNSFPKVENLSLALYIDFEPFTREEVYAGAYITEYAKKYCINLESLVLEHFGLFDCIVYDAKKSVNFEILRVSNNFNHNQDEESRQVLLKYTNNLQSCNYLEIWTPIEAEFNILKLIPNITTLELHCNSDETLEIVKSYQKNVFDVHFTGIMNLSGAIYDLSGPTFMELFSFAGLRHSLIEISLEVFDEDSIITLKDWNLEFPNLTSLYVSMENQSHFGDFFGIECFLKCCPKIVQFSNVRMIKFCNRDSITLTGTYDPHLFWDNTLKFLWTDKLQIRNFKQAVEFVEKDKIIDNISRCTLVNKLQFNYTPKAKDIIYCLSNFKYITEIILINDPGFIYELVHSINSNIKITKFIP